MTSKHIFQKLGLVVFGLAFAIGLSYVSAAVYTDPGATPPEGNTPFLINTGMTSQIKEGGLSVKKLSAVQNAQLDGTTIFGRTIYAGGPGNTVNFGGVDSANILHKVALFISGSLEATGALSSTPLSNTVFSKVCSDADGKVVLCPASLDVCKNIAGKQETVPAGYVVNSAGTCTPKTKRFYSVYGNGAERVEKFVGNVFGGEQTYHAGNSAQYRNTLVDTVGLGNAGKQGWMVSQIPGIQITGFDGRSRLLNVEQKGSYNFKISSEGTFAIKGKDGSARNSLGLDVYLRVNGNAISMVAPGEKFVTSVAPPSFYNHEPYPISGDTTSDFVVFAYPDAGVFEIGGQGDEWQLGRYKFNFERTMNLVPGDSVDIVIYVHGSSQSCGTFSCSFANFFYSIDPGQTVFDILLTPDL